MAKIKPFYTQTDSQRKISVLRPAIAAAANAALADCAEAGYCRLAVRETYRTPSRQDKLYGQGRSRELLKREGIDPAYSAPLLPVVTFATHVTGKHCRCEALDVDLRPYPMHHWCIIAHHFKKHGFKWGGDWRMKDYNHFEFDG